MSYSFVGPDQVACFRAITIAGGLKLYAKAHMQPNAHWTPRRMMDAARAITGQDFKPRAYLEAARALELWAKRQAEVPFDPPFTHI